MTNYFKSWKHPCEICKKTIFDRRTRRCLDCWINIKSAPLIERFFRHVNKTNNCWIWTAGTTPRGYGTYHELGQSGAHRVSWILHYGPIPKHKLVLHKCDNPICVNPGHLFLGSQKENIRDCIQKGRWHSGEKHPMAKLTKKHCIEIKSLYATGKFTQKEIGKKYGVTKSPIQALLKGKTWKGVI